MHVLRGVVGKLKVAATDAIPFGEGEIVLINGVKQSALGLEKTILRQAVLKLRGKTPNQILLH